jgi:hypothetical protein
MSSTASGLGAIAVASKIGRDYAKMLREDRRDRMPHRVGLRIAMQQQQRRSASAATHHDFGFPDIQPVQIEALKHSPPRFQIAQSNFRKRRS